jgi:hypothetical protein
MENPSKAPPSVILAAIVAILSALFFLLVASVTFFSFLLVKLPPSAPELPPFAKGLGLGMMGFMACLSIFGIATGIGLIYLRNWARISILVWAGVFAFFGAVGIPFAFLLPKFTPLNAPQPPDSGQHLVQGILIFTYGFPLVIGLWWLILFNLKSLSLSKRISRPHAIPSRQQCRKSPAARFPLACSHGYMSLRF